jgi:hypothetical protein
MSGILCNETIGMISGSFVVQILAGIIYPEVFAVSVSPPEKCQDRTLKQTKL